LAIAELLDLAAAAADCDLVYAGGGMKFIQLISAGRVSDFDDVRNKND